MQLSKNTTAFFIFLCLPCVAFSARPKSGSILLSLSGVVNANVEQVAEGEQRKYDLGAGGLVEANFNEDFGIETGAIFLVRQYESSTSSIRVVQEAQRIHVPAMAKYWFSDFFSVGVGPFIAFKVGSKSTALEIGDQEVGSIETSADDSLEFGLDSAATLNFAFNNKTGVFIEGRYSYPLGQEVNESSDHFSGLLGFKMDFEI